MNLPHASGQRPRIGVMGGTFDPIHHGHLVAASEVQAWFDLDEVVFVPTGEPWQKTARQVSPAEDRYLMTVIATASNPRFSVSRVDIDRGGPTYTKDTLSDLRALNPGADLPVVGGRADQEDVGDHQLIGHVEGDDVVGQPLLGCGRGRPGEPDGVLGRCHAVSWSVPVCCGR